MIPGLGGRVAKGAAWMVGCRFIIRGIGVVSVIILARLLRPQDFGLFSLAAALLGTLDVFGNFSFNIALIRDAEATREHYDTVWTLTILRGLGVALALCALGRPASIFFNDPRVEGILYFFALGTFLDGLQNVGIIDFRKSLNFHREFAFQIICKLAGFIFTVTFAILWRSYWALVVGMLAAKIAGLAASYIMHPFRPRLCLREWRSLFGFSKWLLTSNISTFLSSRLDTFVIGRVVGTYALGLYEIASEISNLPTGELVLPIQTALYPGYAKLISDPRRLAGSYIEVLAVLMIIAIPASVGIVCVADLLIRVFLGTRWLEALPLLQVLSIAGLMKLGSANTVPILLALGRSKLTSHLAFANLAILAVFIVGGAMAAGAIGTAYGVVVASAIISGIYITTTLRVLSLSVRPLIIAVWRTLAAVAVMTLAVHFLIAGWPQIGTETSAIVKLAAAVAVGILVYGVALLGFWRLAGAPEGAETMILRALAPRLRQWRTGLGFGG